MLSIQELTQESIQEFTDKIEQCSEFELEKLNEELNKFYILHWRYFVCNKESQNLQKDNSTRNKTYKHFVEVNKIATIGTLSPDAQKCIMTKYELFQLTLDFIKKKKQEKIERGKTIFRNTLQEKIPILLQKCEYEDIIKLKKVVVEREKYNIYLKGNKILLERELADPSLWISNNWKNIYVSYRKTEEIFTHEEMQEILVYEPLFQTMKQSIEQRYKEFNDLLKSKNIVELYSVIFDQSVAKFNHYNNNHQPGAKLYRDNNSCRLQIQMCDTTNEIKVDGHYVKDILRYVDKYYFDTYSFDWIRNVLGYPFEGFDFFNNIYPSFINTIITADYIKHHLVKTQNALINLNCGSELCEILYNHQKSQEYPISPDVKNLIRVNKYFASSLTNEKNKCNVYFCSDQRVGCEKGCGKQIIVLKDTVLQKLPRCALCDELKVYKKGEKIPCGSWAECHECLVLFYLPIDSRPYKGTIPKCEICLRRR